MQQVSKLEKACRIPRRGMGIAQAILSTLLLSSYCLQAAAQLNFTYRWAYRNPLSITHPHAFDEGQGSYNGTVNSRDNQAPSGTLALRYSHGATTAFLPNGSFAVIWQGSPNWWEGNMQQAAYWALSDDGGQSFGPATLFYSLPGVPLWLPTIHVENKTVYLFYSGAAPLKCKYQEEGGLAYPPGGDLIMVSSIDSGKSWSSPLSILEASAEGQSAKLNIGKIVVDSRGDWLLPIWRERSNPSCWAAAGAHMDGVPGVMGSSDKGKSWKMLVSAIPPAANAPATQWLIENVIVRYQDATSGASSLLQTFRSNTSSLWQSRSLNDGRNWTAAVPGPITAPNTKSDMTELPDGSILVVFNNATTVRTNLTLARSTNGGVSWQHLAVIESAPNAGFSYPTVTYHPERAMVSVVYSVWQLPSNASLASNSFPDLSSMAKNLTTQNVLTAGRRLLSQPAGSRKLLELPARRSGRELKQVPFNVGAWGKVSYGIRTATIGASKLVPSLQSPALALSGR